MWWVEHCHINNLVYDTAIVSRTRRENNVRERKVMRQDEWPLVNNSNKLYTINLWLLLEGDGWGCVLFLHLIRPVVRINDTRHSKFLTSLLLLSLKQLVFSLLKEHVWHIVTCIFLEQERREWVMIIDLVNKVEAMPLSERESLVSVPWNQQHLYRGKTDLRQTPSPEHWERERVWGTRIGVGSLLQMWKCLFDELSYVLLHKLSIGRYLHTRGVIKWCANTLILN